MQIEDFLEKAGNFQKIVAGLKDQGSQLVTGLSGSAKTVFLSTLLKQSQRPILVVTDSLEHMQDLVDDLENELSADQVFQFPVEESIAMEMATSSPDFRLERVQALNALQTGQKAVIVTAAAGLRRRLPQVDAFKAAQLHLTVGGELDPVAIRQQLSSMGYRRQKMVAAPGDFTIRG